MAGKTEETLDNQVEQVPSDPWAMAFAALDKEDEKDSEAAPVLGGVDGSDTVHGDLSDTDDADSGEGALTPEGGDGTDTEGGIGRPGDLGGADSGQDDDADWDGLNLTEPEIKEYEDRLMEDIRQRTLEDVSRAYIKQGARNNNGQLGASINDPDVCKRDSDGVPRFYNPETGREFTGDNPRRQAQEWVDDYNKELANAFNKTCASYSQKLLEQEGGRLAIIKFAPKYRALDPMRRSMFEAVIEDYEVTDNAGNIVAYSIDLDKALAAVNRQVRAIQTRYKSQQQNPAPTPSGPALDTPSTNGQQASGKPQFKSIEEAMEWEQDQLLAKMKNKKGAR